MGQIQSNSSNHGNRKDWNAATSVNGTSSDHSKGGRHSSPKRPARTQTTYSSKMSMKSLNRRSRVVRKSISSFVKPKAGIQASSYCAQVNETHELTQVDIPAASSHRSAWRRSIAFVKSKRWHKAPDHSTTNEDDGGQNIGSSGSLSPPSSSSCNPPISLPTCGPDSRRASSPLSENSGPDLDTAILSSADVRPTLTPPSPLEENDSNPSTTSADSAAGSYIQAAGSMTVGQAETTDSVIIAAEQPVVVVSNDANTHSPPQFVASSVEHDSTPSGTETAPIFPSRPQFPPSGTLVVVQGVVHTTDVQIQNPNSTPQVSSELPQSPDDLGTVRRTSSISSGPRGRLSALLHRSHGAPSDSRARSVSSALDRSSIGSANEALVDVGQSADREVIAVQPTLPPTQPFNQRGNIPGAISSSSVDVLGTLLSVAAAATAASLLTGSSDTSSSMNTTHPSLAAIPDHPLNLQDPTSTTPPSAASLSSYPSSNPSSPAVPPTTSSNSAQTDFVGDTDRAERMRHIWSTVRNRLGITHGQPFSRRTGSDNRPQSYFNRDADASTNNTAVRSSPEPAADAHNARERMLNEIARAFNLGFSSTPSPTQPLTDVASDMENTTEERTAGRAEEESSNAESPSVGTFEHFLLELQNDLRSVLTTGGRDQTISRRQEPVNQEENASRQLPHHEPQPEDDSEEDSIASLRDASDSDDDTESDSSHSTSSSSSSLGFVSPTAQQPTVSETPHDLFITRPRINYWRLYRFPPIPTARAHAAADNVVQNMRSGLGELTRTATLAPTPATHLAGPTRPSVSTDSGIESGVGIIPTLSEDHVPQNSSNAGSSSVVVPVIIVGLQSVNPFWATEPLIVPTSPTSESPMPSRADDTLRSTATPTSGSRTGASTSTSHAGMTGRGTQTQSSDTTSQNTGIPAPLPDSRTFLIYVIGGYYPPDHEIVVGTAENGVLDSSFEALLLLNELLHHPPFEMPATVSKEQLDKSGLEVIPSEQMPEWVKAGKIQSNCLERCLICLDEYNEDSVRVLECKHAFHMNCVDRWLLEGRNSCPACRGKGVFDGNEAR